MTDAFRMVGNVFRGCSMITVEPAEGMVIKDNVFVNSDSTRDPGDLVVEPSAGEDQAE